MLETVIGLEIHIQLKTKSKLFCGCKNSDGDAANTHVCPICLAHPGTLPAPNAQAFKLAMLAAMALNCKIPAISKFDRKHYFYPDLPKGYQISQHNVPIGEHGSLEIEVPTKKGRLLKTIRLTRIHMEEDSAKSFHGADGRTYVDFNRAGTPLVEIVTEPDIESPEEAKVFLQELRLVARTLGFSDADMEKGHLRCDANISLRERDQKTGDIIGPKFHPKTEIKNINSFRYVEKALLFEIERQTALWKTGTPPSVETTRGWNSDKGITEEQRRKEGQADYRFFPEPDIPPFSTVELQEKIKSSIPELPFKKRQRFQTEYNIKPEDARQIVDDPKAADFIEQVFSELYAWLKVTPEYADLTEEDQTKENGRVANLVSGWFLSKLGGLLAENSIDVRTMHITPENFAEFITLVATKRLNTNTGLQVLKEMLLTGKDPSHIMEDGQLGQMSDTNTLSDIILRVIEGHADDVARYRAGKKELLGFFIGLIMKESEGTADPKLAKNILLTELNKDTE